MRTEYVDPRYGLNPDETHWVYTADDVRSLLRFIEKGQKDKARRILQERRFPLGWQSNK